VPPGVGISPAWLVALSIQIYGNRVVNLLLQVFLLQIISIWI
jgi:hypothetical protein